MEDANKKQLLQIALYEDCDLDLKYEACRELQLKRWDGVFIRQLVKYWGEGYTPIEIADKFGVELWEVYQQLRIHDLNDKTRVKKGRVS